MKAERSVIVRMPDVAMLAPAEPALQIGGREIVAIAEPCQ